MTEDPRSPLELLEALTVQEVEIAPDLRHLEIYTMRGLLTLLWHGPSDAERVLVTVGGGMGSLLGPADGLYHDLGVRFAAQGIGTVRVGYRKPNDLARACDGRHLAADKRQAGAVRPRRPGRSRGQAHGSVRRMLGTASARARRGGRPRAGAVPARPAAQAGELAAAQQAEAAAPQASGSLDIISTVAGPLAKQFAPVLAGLTLGVVLGFLLGHRRRPAIVVAPIPVRATPRGHAAL